MGEIRMSEVGAAPSCKYVKIGPWGPERGAMNYEQLNDVCKRRGKCPAVDTAGIDPEINKMFEKIFTDFNQVVKKINDEYKYYKGVNLTIGFDESVSFSAWTCTDEDNDLIILSYQPILWMRHLFATIYNNGRGPGSFVMPRPNGTPPREAAFKMPETVDMFAELRAGKRPAVRDADDANYASHLFQIAVHAVLHHEFAHIWDGHTGFILEKDNTVLRDASSAEEEYDSSDYAFEMDADCRALRGLLNWHFATLNVPLDNAPISTPNGKLSDREFAGLMLTVLAATDLFVAIYLSMRMIMIKNGFSGDKVFQKGRSHPPIYFRIRIQISELHNYLRVYSRFLADFVTYAVHQAIGEAEKAFNAATGEPEIDIFSDEISQDYSAMFVKAAAAWDNLKVQLMPHIRGRGLTTYSTYPDPTDWHQ